MIIPRNRRLYVWVIRERAKIGNLYRCSGLWGSKTRAEDVWIAAVAKDCKHVWNVGDRGLISDGFELEPYSPIEWSGEEGGFEHLVRLAKECEGVIESQIIHEDSLLALVSPEVALQENQTARDGTGSSSLVL